MEREMCRYLDWDFTFDNLMLDIFGKQVREDFSRNRESYPLYPLGFVSKRVAGVDMRASRISFEGSRGQLHFGHTEQGFSLHPLQSQMFGYAIPSEF